MDKSEDFKPIVLFSLAEEDHIWQSCDYVEYKIGSQVIDRDCLNISFGQGTLYETEKNFYCVNDIDRKFNVFEVLLRGIDRSIYSREAKVFVTLVPFLDVKSNGMNLVILVEFCSWILIFKRKT